jgi:hypothetical protein
MAKLTIWFGAALVVLGILSYVGSGAASPTALIPAVVGVILAALGVAGRQEDRRALTMHAAAAVALLGFLGSAMGLASLPDLVTGESLERPWAVGAQSAMAFILAVYLALSIRSFVAARKGRAAREGGAGVRP